VRRVTVPLIAARFSLLIRDAARDIRVGDWYYAFRVAVLGNDCHFAIDRKGRRAAEPLIEAIIIDRFADMNLSEDQVKELLLECAAEVQTEHREFEQYLVTL
jgi:hypothetical protein